MHDVLYFDRTHRGNVLGRELELEALRREIAQMSNALDGLPIGPARPRRTLGAK